MAIIPIRHRLLIVGDKVKVPGHEPLSEQTTRSLSVAFQGRDVYISLTRALELIPDAAIVRSTLNQGTGGVEKYLELPSGPVDGNECVCPEDLYKLLRDAASFRSESTQASMLDDCSAFDFGKCDYTDFTNDLDPKKRQ